MASKITNALLALLVCCCPIWCGAGICSSAEDGCTEEVAQRKCCHHCQENASAPGDRTPDNSPDVPHDDSPCGTCQCFCGGAVVEHRAALLDEHHVVSHEYVRVANDVVPELLLSQSLQAANSHNGSLSPGRRLCILHMSLLI